MHNNESMEVTAIGTAIIRYAATGPNLPSSRTGSRRYPHLMIIAWSKLRAKYFACFGPLRLTSRHVPDRERAGQHQPGWSLPSNIGDLL